MSDHDLFDKTQDSNEDHWIPLSDLMTGLMLIFMLIAIAFMMRVEAQTLKIRQIAILYDQERIDLYNDLMKEFGKDLPKWDAEITKDLVVRFNNPEILFDTGRDELKPTFQAILASFFPRYMRIVMADKYRNQIQEIRIEGHTSSKWAGTESPEEAYFRNMALSQSRTRSTLRYVLGLPDVSYGVPWLRQHMTANGLSSSHLIMHNDGTEDVERSQRVEFHIRTDAAGSIASIVESFKK